MPPLFQSRTALVLTFIVFLMSVFLCVGLVAVFFFDSPAAPAPAQRPDSLQQPLGSVQPPSPALGAASSLSSPEGSVLLRGQ